MGLIQVGQVWKTQRELIIGGNAHIKVLGGSAPRSLAKDVQAEITSLAPLAIDINCKTGSGGGPSAWGLKLQIKRELWGQYFTPDTAPAQAPARQMGVPNLMQMFEKLSKRQRAVAEGLTIMREARAQLQKDIAAGNSWATVGVLASAALLPLNVILNAFDVKAAVSIYQAVVKEMYNKLARSGTRIDNRMAKESLPLIKRAIVEELKRKGFTAFVPGVNVIVGMAEDSFALMETISKVAEGSRETRALLQQVDGKISQAMNEFTRIGVEMERLFTEMDTRSRTA